jgi:phosphatase NudJ
MNVMLAGIDGVPSAWSHHALSLHTTTVREGKVCAQPKRVVLGVCTPRNAPLTLGALIMAGMHATPRWKPSVTVAAVIEHDGQYLLVEEHTAEGLRLNNPAGHVEPGESPLEAVCREVLEETACVFEPTHFLGVYLARFVREATGEDVTYLRLAYGGRVGPPDPARALDAGIVRTLWLPHAALQANVAQHRSALVLQCIGDHSRGVRLPLGAVQDDGSLRQPTRHPARKPNPR